MKKIIIALFSIVISLTVYSQKEEKISHRPIVITSADSIVYANALMEVPKRHNTDIAKNYYWYASNKISTNKGGYSGKLLDGSFEVYDVHGNLLKQGFFVKGLKHDEWKTWNSNGHLIRYEKWTEGRVNSIKVFNSRGKLVKEDLFEKDQKKALEKEKKANDRAIRSEERSKAKLQRKQDKEKKKEDRKAKKEANTTDNAKEQKISIFEKTKNAFNGFIGKLKRKEEN